MMRKLLVGVAVVLAAAGALWAAPAYALDVPLAPSLDRPIVDMSGTLSDRDISTLSDQINAGRQTKDYQIGILMIPTLGTDEYLEGYSIKVARQWGIGDAAKDNGVLILVVKNDRKIRIEVGRGLEGDLTDAQAGRIIRDVIAPEFRNDNYVGGLSKAIESIQAVVENRADPNAASTTVSFNWFELAIGLLALPVWLGSVLGRSKSWWLGGVLGGVTGGIVAMIAQFSAFSIFGWVGAIGLGLLFDFLVSRSYRAHTASHTPIPWWIGGGTGSSSGGGGSGGFGGGGFSGGGSSGSW